MGSAKAFKNTRKRIKTIEEKKKKKYVYRTID